MLLFEKNTYANMILNTYYTDIMEAPSCGDDGFFLKDEERATYSDMNTFYCVPPNY